VSYGDEYSEMEGVLISYEGELTQVHNIRGFSDTDTDLLESTEQSRVFDYLEPNEDISRLSGKGDSSD